MARPRSTTPKPPKKFGDVFANYKTYNPRVEGYGSEDQWSNTFHNRMGFEEAEEILHGDDQTPRFILGVGADATWDQIKKAYRMKAMEVHPDRCSIHGLTKDAAEEAFKRLSAAYTVLEREFGK